MRKSLYWSVLGQLKPSGGISRQTRRIQICFYQKTLKVVPVQSSRSVVSDSLRPHELQHPTPLSIANSRCLLKLMSIESGMPSNQLILCHPLLLLPSIFPSIRVFSNESVLCIRWPKHWSFSFNISPSSEYSGLISFRMDRFSMQSKGLSRVFYNTIVQKHQFFGAQASLCSNSHIWESFIIILWFLFSIPKIAPEPPGERSVLPFLTSLSTTPEFILKRWLLESPWEWGLVARKINMITKLELPVTLPYILVWLYTHGALETEWDLAVHALPLKSHVTSNKAFKFSGVLCVHSQNKAFGLCYF